MSGSKNANDNLARPEPAVDTSTLATATSDDNQTETPGQPIQVAPAWAPIVAINRAEVLAKELGLRIAQVERFAVLSGAALPDDFVTRTTFLAYAALILGGAARVGGPIVGGIIWYTLFSFMNNLVTQMKAADVFPSGVKPNAGQLPFIFLGLALMALVIFRPQGIFGDRKEVELDAR